jgi:hypothetical protein
VVAVARRRVLIGGTVGAGLLLAGCTSDGPSGSAPTTPPPPDPLLAELVDERRLIAAYDATIGRYPALRARLTAVRADHAAHAAALVTALGAEAPVSPSASVSRSAGPSATGGAPSPTPAVAATAGAALAALRAAERSAASARGTVALTAPADRARLLAGISASEASHLAVLA